MAVKYQRVLLKLSGESLAGDAKFGIDGSLLITIAQEIKALVDQGLEIAIVVGGGNFFRGLSGAAEGMDRINADYIGMLATAMNALSLQQAFEKIGLPSRVLSALAIDGVAEPYIRARALKHLRKKKVVIFATGTGNPLFTTDTAASLRAIEVNCDLMIKATRVDGIYNADPEKVADAKRYDTLTYDQVLAEDLKVMDLTAVTLCRENAMPIRVIDFHQAGNLSKAIQGEPVGTLVTV